MKKWFDGYWVHRSMTVMKDEQGIYVVGCLHLFKTLTDAEIYIDQTHDFDMWQRKWNGRKPRIIGEWKMRKEETQ